MQTVAMGVHHIGFAARSLDETQRAFEELGAVFYQEFTDIERNLDFRFAKMNDMVLEFISPHDKNNTCAVSKIVEKQLCTPYHICLNTSNFAEELIRLKGLGYKQVGNIITSDVYGYTSSGVFLYGKGTGLIELVSCENKDGD